MSIISSINLVKVNNIIYINVVKLMKSISGRREYIRLLNGTATIIEVTCAHDNHGFVVITSG